MSETWILVEGPREVGALVGTLIDEGGAGFAGAAPAVTAVTAVVVGPRALADDTARSVARVIWVDPADGPVENAAPTVAGLVAEARPGIVLAPETPAGRVLAGAAAVHLGAALVSGATAVAAGTVDSTQLDGRVIATQRIADGAPLCATVPPSDQEPPALATPGSVEAVPPSSTAAFELIGREERGAEAGGVTEAERIVSVGRGIGSKEVLAQAQELAALLHAEIGCSMPVAEDWGWVTQDRYIGRSGQQVSPRLYLAVGISGAPQHLEGIRGAKTVVAVNSDPDAPIFRAADYGIVGDAAEVVPALTAAVRERRPMGLSMDEGGTLAR